jgi:hypothetical protein
VFEKFAMMYLLQIENQTLQTKLASGFWQNAADISRPARSILGSGIKALKIPAAVALGGTAVLGADSAIRSAFTSKEDVSNFINKIDPNRNLVHDMDVDATPLTEYAASGKLTQKIKEFYPERYDKSIKDNRFGAYSGGVSSEDLRKNGKSYLHLSRSLATAAHEMGHAQDTNIGSWRNSKIPMLGVLRDEGVANINAFNNLKKHQGLGTAIGAIPALAGSFAGYAGTAALPLAFLGGAGLKAYKLLKGK